MFTRSNSYVGYIIVLIDVTKDVEMDQLRSHFISNVSHELRTPVTVLRSYIDTLYNFGNDFDFNTQREFIGVMNQEIIRLNRMVNDILDFSKIEQKPNQPTRAASAAVLGYLADNVENMIVSSADLSNSDKTDGFLKKTHPIVNGDFSGRFLNAGVSELTMACIMNGIVLHGGWAVQRLFGAAWIARGYGGSPCRRIFPLCSP
jgi:signal transduction histidine kinase